MSEIDFLPDDYRELLGERQARRWRKVFVMVVLAVMPSAVLVQHRTKQQVQARLDLAREALQLQAAQSSRIAQLEGLQRHVSSQAELLTFLRHPWPRTRLLRALLDPLPESLRLDKVNIEAGTTAATISSGAEQVVSPEMAPTNSSAAEGEAQDLEQLRTDVESRRWHLVISGTTTDAAALHAYLDDVAGSGLLEDARLDGVDAQSDREGHEMRFSARFLIRSALGASTKSDPSVPAPAAVGQTLGFVSGPGVQP